LGIEVARDQWKCSSRSAYVQASAWSDAQRVQVGSSGSPGADASRALIVLWIGVQPGTFAAITQSAANAFAR
jgi:hypothetical protein